MTDVRLIEAAFPLRQVSLDSVHEKNVRHGHVSTLHIWPARRPLAASRAALLATLLPDPGSRDGRRALSERMAGRVVEAPAAGGGRMKEEARGGVFHWGRVDSGEIDRFRAEIREAFGGRAPRVLDPFAGGGAIPLEAMRLGCEAVAADINPVAWFILRCTLHHPRRLAGETRPLPAFALRERAFVEAFLKARGVTKATALREGLARYGHGDGEAVQVTSPHLESASPMASADFAWHLRAWGRRVLAGARRELAARYPTYAEFEPVRRKGRGRTAPQPEARYRPRPPRRLEPDAEGRVSAASLNAEFDSLYLENDANPRWVAKPAVAYLWARTVRCSNCRAEIPLLKTRWLCRKAKKRVLLTMEPRQDGAGPSALSASPTQASASAQADEPTQADRPPQTGEPTQAGGAARADRLTAEAGEPTQAGRSAQAAGVVFGIERDVAEGGETAARKREHGRALGASPNASSASLVQAGASARADELAQAGRLTEASSAFGASDAAKRKRPSVHGGAAPADGPAAQAGGVAQAGRSVHADGVVFGVARDVPEGSGTAAQKREHDRMLAAGTMSGSGAECPCCGAIATMKDLRAEGRAGRLGERMTAVVVDGQEGKEYRLPTDEELESASVERQELEALYAEIPFGLPNEPTPSEQSLGMRIPRYGFDTWGTLFTDRQLLALGTFVREIRRTAGLTSEPRRRVAPLSSEERLNDPPWEPTPLGVDDGPRYFAARALPANNEERRNDSSWEFVPPGVDGNPRYSAAQAFPASGKTPVDDGPPASVAARKADAGLASGKTPFDRGSGSSAAGAEPIDDYPHEWREAITVYMSCALNKFADYSSAICSWHNSGEKIGHTFARFALPMVWDYCEVNPLAGTTGGFLPSAEWVARVCEHVQAAADGAPAARVLRQSAIDELPPDDFDLICTDPPYYDAIPYSDLMDFFYVWLRRTLHGLSPETDAAFAGALGPKWDAEAGDGELIDDASRFGGDRQASKQNYEDGMARSFSRFHDALRDDGRLVIVFANKQPDAWETLVSALIRAGFVVDGSWPIRTEMQNRQRSLASAALSSSIWLVCKKRPAAARPGWDGKVLAEMQENVRERLRDFWDAGIRGPDFVWAATGPALEAFSRHPVVRKADREGERLTVAEFLRRVRRMVVGFVVSRLLERSGDAADELDDPTTYYLLHRSDFGLRPAPAGACILYALSCNLSDAELAGRLDLLARGGGAAGERPAPAADDDGEAAAEEDGLPDLDPDRQTGGGARGGEVRLKPWNRRRARDLGEPAADGGPPPLVDCVHKLMRLWKTGEQTRVDAYLEARGLWRHELFSRVAQALIELADRGSEERATLESIQNHVRTRGGAPAPRQRVLV